MYSKAVDYVVWLLLATGYMLTAAFVLASGNRLAWLTIPLALKQQLPLIICALLFITFTVGALRPRKIWFAVPLVIAIALLTVGYLTIPDCGKGDICVVAY